MYSRVDKSMGKSKLSPGATSGNKPAPIQASKFDDRREKAAVQRELGAVMTESVQKQTIQRNHLMLADRPWAEVEALEATFGHRQIVSGGLAQIPKNEDVMRDMRVPRGMPPAKKTPKHLDEARSRRKKAKRVKRREQDKADHAERRRLNSEIKPLLENKLAAELELKKARAELTRMMTDLEYKKGKAGNSPGRRQLPDGEYSRKIGEIRQIQSKESTLSREMGHENVFSKLEEDDDIAVPTPALREKKAALTRLLTTANGFKTRLTRLNTDLPPLVAWLDRLVESAGAKKAITVYYPKVWVHKKVKRCPHYQNIPWESLNSQTQTGTHGKSAVDAFVHKKLAGGYAITFGYKGAKTYIIDCGPKESGGGNKYDWKRGGTAYDSPNGIGNFPGDYYQE